MMWPKLVPPQLCNTGVTVRLESGIGLDGSPEYTTVWSGRCNYSEKARTILDAQRQAVRLEATVLIDGDIAPGQDIAGEAVITAPGAPETVRRIYRSERGRNPDGTVNFTRLELM